MLNAEQIIFAFASGAFMFAVGWVLSYYNATFLSSLTVSFSTWGAVGSIWVLMLIINFTPLTLKNVLKLMMIIAMIASIYFFVIFEMAGAGCPQDTSIWGMLESVF